MEVGKLTVQLRDQSGKGHSRRMRTEGFVPGVCYGTGLEEPISITVSPKALKAALDPKKRQNTVIDVTVENNGSKERNVTCMLWEYQVHPIRQVVTHVDLKAIDPDKLVEAEIPVVLTGKHAGAIEGGILSWVRRQATVRCKPADIPATVEADVTSLNIGDALHVSDLPLPAGIEMVDAGTLTVVTCVAPRGVEVAAEAPAEGEAAEGAEAEGGEASPEEKKD